jgi:hypothetical protein
MTGATVIQVPGIRSLMCRYEFQPESDQNSRRPFVNTVMRFRVPWNWKSNLSVKILHYVVRLLRKIWGQMAVFGTRGKTAKPILWLIALRPDLLSHNRFSFITHTFKFLQIASIAFSRLLAPSTKPTLNKWDVNVICFLAPEFSMDVWTKCVLQILTGSNYTQLHVYWKKWTNLNLNF